MEIKIEAVDGCSMPSGSYVAVKLGESLKQGRYAPAMSYTFPKANKRHTAKIDIFKHVGTSTLMVAPDSGYNMKEVDIASNDPLVGNLRLRIDMKPSDAEKKANAAQAKSAARQQAASYLEKHRIEERLADSMKQLLHKQPDDPIEFLCSSLRGVPYDTSLEEIRQFDNAKEAVSSSEPQPDSSSVRQALAEASNDGRLLNLLHASTDPNAPPNQKGSSSEAKVSDDRMRGLCMQAHDTLVNASEDGSLERALAGAQVEASPSAEKPLADVVSRRPDVPIVPFTDYYKQNVLPSVACSVPAKAESGDEMKGMRNQLLTDLTSAAQDGRLEAALVSGSDPESGDPQSTKQQAQGLAEAAISVAELRPVSAAGLASAAVARATCLPTASQNDSAQMLAGLAEMAVAAAESGSASAPGLIKAAAEACIAFSNSNSF